MKKLILLAFILTAAVSQAKEEKDCPRRSAAGMHANTNPAPSKAVRPAAPQNVRTQR